MMQYVQERSVPCAELFFSARSLRWDPGKTAIARQNHQIYIQGLVETASQHAILDFLRCRCSKITDHHFRKLDKETLGT
jgi:hypothetical protein